VIADTASLTVLLDDLRLLYQQAEDEREYSLSPLDVDYASFSR
jgi:hypothetical protein